MPEKLHRELSARAGKLGLVGDRHDAFVHGTMNKIEKRRGLKRKRGGSSHGSHNTSHGSKKRVGY